MEEELQASLLSAMQRMMETFGRAERSARTGNLHEAMVFRAALEKDAGGSAQALANALGALDDLEETGEALKKAYDDSGE